MHQYSNGVMCVNIMGNTINRFFLFCSICAKKPVIDDKDTSHIFIKVLRVAGMVYPVIGRCVENMIQYSKFINTFSMYKYIVQGCKRIKKYDHKWRNAEKTKR